MFVLKCSNIIQGEKNVTDLQGKLPLPTQK